MLCQVYHSMCDIGQTLEATKYENLEQNCIWMEFSQKMFQNNLPVLYKQR